MTLDTTQRVLFAIPTPRTELTIGQFFEKRDDGNNATTTQYAGIGAYTDADLRFNASGAAAQSELIAQAQGQLWLQAVGHVAGVSGESLLVASPEMTLVAGQGGVTILAGFAPGALATQTDTGAMPTAVSGYSSTALIPTMVWGIFDTVAALGLTLLDAYLTITDKPTGTSWYTAFNKWGLQGSAANLAGAAINIAGLSGSPHVTLPGINMFSQAGILIGSALGGVNIIGVPGLLIQSTFTTQFAIIASGVRGLASASMMSLKSADVTALTDVTVRAMGDVAMASRADDAVLRGVNMKIGMRFPKTLLVPGTPQLPTASIKLQAVNEVSLHSSATLDVDATKFESKSVKELSFDGGDKVSFKVGTFEITLDSSTAELAGSTGGSIAMDATTVTVAGPGGAAEASMSPQLVKLKAGAGSCLFDIPAKKLTVDGTTFDIK